MRRGGEGTGTRGCGFVVAFAAFSAAGLADWLVAAADAGELTGGVWLALPVCVGTWILAGTAAGVVQWLTAALLFGFGLGRDVLDRFGRWWHMALLEHSTPDDRARVARLWSFTTWALLVAAGSVGWAWYLVANRHGAGLIAVAVVAGEAALAAAAAVPARAVYRVCAWVLARVRPNTVAARLCSFGVSSGLLAAVLVAAGVVAAVLFEKTLVAVDGISLALPAAALGLEVPGYYLLRRRVRDGWWAAAVPVAAFLVVWAAAYQGEARQAVTSYGCTSKYFLSGLQKGSDFDGDNVPVFPAFDDCAPFDASISPYAAEEPDNGVDENCDGLDSAPDFGPKRVQAEKRLAPWPRKPDLLLVTLDATRADHVGTYGYERDTTPHLDRLAKKARVFARAYAQDSGTGPALWSMMVGKTPFQVHLVEAEHFPPNYADDEVTLAEVLKEGGYATSAVTCGRVLGKKTWNIRRGFEKFDMPCLTAASEKASTVLKSGLAELKRLRRGGGKPFFLWVHFFDPHTPYTPHPEFEFGDSPMDDYDEEIRYTDEQLGKLLDEARKPSKSRSVFIAISADHGENFAEHGRDPHARTLYAEVTHVPLVIYGPEVAAGVAAEPVATSDLFPTFIELAGLEVPEASTMVSLAPMLLGEAGDPERMVFQENSWSRPTHHVKGVVQGWYHMIMDLTAGTVELYDLENDPGEKENLYGMDVPEEVELHRALLWFIQTTEIPPEIR